MNKFIIGLDIGTSSVKGILADENGKIIDTARYAFEYDTDENGKIEIPADRYLDTCCSALRQLCESLPAGGELCSISAASASGNVMILDQNYNPLTPIVNWQDTRTGDEVGQVLGTDFDYDAYFRSTGWAFSGRTFPLATLCRLKKDSPELFKKGNKVAMSTEYLYYMLTGSWGLSTSAGTPFYLIDQVSGEYRKDILDILGLDCSQLPPIVHTGSTVGRVTAQGSAASGIPEGVKIAAGTFDHPSAARGTGILETGQMLLSCGTSWVGFYPVSSRECAVENHMLIDPFLSENGGPWAGMVSLASVSTEIKKYITEYVSDEGNVYKNFEAYSAQSERGAGGLTINFENDDPDYIRSFPKKHIARAIMEGVVNKLNSDFTRLAQGGIRATGAVMVGGPTECPLWTQVIEYITGMPVIIRHGAFAGSVGAAMVAGINAGIWADEKAAGRCFY